VKTIALLSVSLVKFQRIPKGLIAATFGTLRLIIPSPLL